MSNGTTSAQMALRDPDVRLMLRVRDVDDDEAFGELVERYQHRLVGILHHLLGNADEADDLAQEVFLRVFRTRKRYHPSAKFSTWLFTIANNLALNALRSRHRKPTVPLPAQDSGLLGLRPAEQLVADRGPAPTQNLQDQELAAVIRHALEGLNERQRMAVVLNKFEDLNYAEIAAVMGLTPQAVKSLLSRARCRLRDALTGYLALDSAFLPRLAAEPKDDEPEQPMPDPQPFTDADRDELVAYLDGELDADGQQRIEARLGHDPRARAEADSLRRAWEMLDYLPRNEPAQDFTERTLTRVTALRPVATVPWYRQPALAYAAWAAAVFVSLALGYRLTPSSSRTGPQLPDPDTDPVYTNQPRVIEHLPQYLAVGNIEFLRALDTPDLFDDETLMHLDADDESHTSVARAADPERRARLQQYLAAYRRLSGDAKERVRKLDRDLHNEDMVMRVRLSGVMERYAVWLAQLGDEDRHRIEKIADNTERLKVVNEMRADEWNDGLPELVVDREKWRKEEGERRRLRLQSLRNAEEAAFLMPAAQLQQQFRDEVRKWVDDTLLPQLKPLETQQLAIATTKGTPYAYYHTVLMLSNSHNLRPPGPPVQWERFRQARAKAEKSPR